MDFVDFLIEERLKESNFNAYVKIVAEAKESKLMGLPEDPDDEKEHVKKTRHKYGYFSIQPPPGYRKLPTKKRAAMYRNMQKVLNMLDDSVNAVNARGLGKVFTFKPDGDKSSPIIRLVDDPDNEYASIYQEQDDDKDGLWERGDYLINISAKNMNIHTLVHEIGHAFHYQVLTAKQKEEWNDYYRLRKYRDKDEFMTKYARENNAREDFSETFAVFVLGTDKINKLYEKARINKNEEMVQKIIKSFKKVVFNMAPKPPKIKKR